MVRTLAALFLSLIVIGLTGGFFGAMLGLKPEEVIPFQIPLWIALFVYFRYRFRGKHKLFRNNHLDLEDPSCVDALCALRDLLTIRGVFNFIHKDAGSSGYDSIFLYQRLRAKNLYPLIEDEVVLASLLLWAVDKYAEATWQDSRRELLERESSIVFPILYARTFNPNEEDRARDIKWLFSKRIDYPHQFRECINFRAKELANDDNVQVQSLVEEFLGKSESKDSNPNAPPEDLQIDDLTKCLFSAEPIARVQACERIVQKNRELGVMAIACSYEFIHSVAMSESEASKHVEIPTELPPEIPPDTEGNAIVTIPMCRRPSKELTELFDKHNMALRKYLDLNLEPIYIDWENDRAELIRQVASAVKKFPDLRAVYIRLINLLDET